MGCVFGKIPIDVSELDTLILERIHYCEGASEIVLSFKQHRIYDEYFEYRGTLLKTPFFFKNGHVMSNLNFIPFTVGSASFTYFHKFPWQKERALALTANTWN